MADTPMILGVPMRFVMSWPTCPKWSLTGFELTRYVGRRQVFVTSEHLGHNPEVPGVMYQSEEQATEAIEDSITRIRAAAAKLGT